MEEILRLPLALSRLFFMFYDEWTYWFPFFSAVNGPSRRLPWNFVAMFMYKKGRTIFAQKERSGGHLLTLPCAFMWQQAVPTFWWEAEEGEGLHLCRRWWTVSAICRPTILVAKAVIPGVLVPHNL